MVSLILQYVIIIRQKKLSSIGCANSLQAVHNNSDTMDILNANGRRLGLRVTAIEKVLSWIDTSTVIVTKWSGKARALLSLSNTVHQVNPTIWIKPPLAWVRPGCYSTRLLVQWALTPTCLTQAYRGHVLSISRGDCGCGACEHEQKRTQHGGWGAKPRLVARISLQCSVVAS